MNAEGNVHSINTCKIMTCNGKTMRDVVLRDEIIGSNEFTLYKRVF